MSPSAYQTTLGLQVPGKQSPSTRYSVLCTLYSINQYRSLYPSTRTSKNLPTTRPQCPPASTKTQSQHSRAGRPTRRSALSIGPSLQATKDNRPSQNHRPLSTIQCRRQKQSSKPVHYRPAYQSISVITIRPQPRCSAALDFLLGLVTFGITVRGTTMAMPLTRCSLLIAASIA